MAKTKRTILLWMTTLLLALLMLPIRTHAETRALMNEDGTITFTVDAVTATTKLTYKTEGFTVKNKPCLPEGNPRKKPYGEIYLSEGQSESYENGSITTTVFTIPETLVRKQFRYADIDTETLATEGGCVFLNGIFQTYVNGKGTGNYYKTLSSIRNAAGWDQGTMLSFKNKFDVTLTYVPTVYPVKIRFYEKQSGTWVRISEKEYEKQQEGNTFRTNASRIPMTSANGYYLYKTCYQYIGSEKKRDVRIVSVNPYLDYGVYQQEYKELCDRSIKMKPSGILVKCYYKKFAKTTTGGSVSMSNDLLLPDVEAVIAADERGAEKFDSEMGIPTGETQYVNIQTDNALVTYRFVKYQGIRNYPYETEEGIQQLIRPYSYWRIQSFASYSIKQAVVENGSLPGTTILYPQNYEKLTIDCKRYSNHLIEGSLTSPVYVRNDFLSINGELIMDGDWYATSTPEPNEKQLMKHYYKKISDHVLYKSHLLIRDTKANGVYPTSGWVIYQTDYAVGSNSGELKVEITEANEVVVHTPVVCDVSLYDAKKYNQMIAPAANDVYASLVLEHEFSVSFPTVGQHLNQLGYGYRDYACYCSDRQIQFPFDVYIGTKCYQAFSWISLQEDTTVFYLPTWVKEGKYQLKCRAIAQNAEENHSIAQEEEYANFEIEHYTAYQYLGVEVSGQLKEFQVYDISDYPLWKSVFRKPFSLALTGENYPVRRLPIMDGSHPTEKGKGSLALGYAFRYRITTIGTMDQRTDYVRIVPHFYHLSHDGKERYEADLYYNETYDENRSYLIRIGSEEDAKNKKTIKTGDPYLSIPKQELSETANMEQMSCMDWLNQEKPVYTFANVMLPYTLRTLIGTNRYPPDFVTGNQIKRSMQHWYGEYYLPAQTYAVKKGFDLEEYQRRYGRLNGKESFWLQDGYILVNFQIETIQDGRRHLSYINKANETYGYCNMWRMEGFAEKKTDAHGYQFAFMEGDCICYKQSDKTTQIYESRGTH
ncbi:MAG: DUF5704 domain-containing protein [Lachnospiraceae bacterium]